MMKLYFSKYILTICIFHLSSSSLLAVQQQIAKKKKAFVAASDLNGAKPGDVALVQLVPRADANRQAKVSEDVRAVGLALICLLACLLACIFIQTMFQNTTQ